MSKNPICDVYIYDEEIVNDIQKQLKKENISKLTKLFKVLGEENRSKITYALLKGEKLCVCDIANIIGTSVANTSHHLRKLHAEGVVKFKKEGKQAFYSLDDCHVETIFMNALEHMKE